MKRAQLDSSMMRSVGYEEPAMVLEIEFRNGGVYQYFEVPRAEYDALIEAPSKGKLFHARIRGVFAYRRLSTQ